MNHINNKPDFVIVNTRKTNNMFLLSYKEGKLESKYLGNLIEGERMSCLSN